MNIFKVCPEYTGFMTFDMTVDTVINAWKRKTCPGTRKSSVMEYLTDAELFFVLCP